MANEEQLSILKQGVEVWNKWRIENYSIDIDLREVDVSGANLREADLTGAYLRGAYLVEADLAGADLSFGDLRFANFGGAHLREAKLYNAYLNDADLRRAVLMNADLNKADLRGADLMKANLSGAHLRETDLRGANLRNAMLDGADLSQADLRGADVSEVGLWDANLRSAILARSNFFEAVIGATVFANSDLSETRELEYAIHSEPSHISADTFARSKGKIPEAFLRGCGLSDWEVEEVKLYNPDLSNDEVSKILYRMYDLRAMQALQISPLFVSYSHADREFVDKLGGQLTEKGIRYWRDIHAMKAGRIEKQVDRAIRQNPTVLLVLSKHSLSSDWVEHEVRTARELEKEMGRDMLCPVALDDSWKASGWPKRVMEQIMEYNILDFSAWEDDNKFDEMFRKLIDGLQLFYKG